jgi:hypothetical protein
MGRTSLLALAVALAAVGALPAAGAAQGGVHFTTPSGNIDCIGQGSTVDCLVERASWPRVPPRPAGCDTDWFGTEAVLSSGRVRLGSCRGDIGPMCVDPGAPCTRLAYGRSLSVRRGGIRCTSRRTGLTCRARNGRGAGFRVAARGYRIFADREP